MNLRNSWLPLILAACLTTSLGCRNPQPVKPAPAKACLLTPPPPVPHLVRTECGLGVCYSQEEARKLALWAAAVTRWAEDAWQLCGPKQE